LVADQLSVELLPLATLEGLALKVSVGADSDCLTETELDAMAWPPGPVQVRVYVLLAERAPVDCEPVTAIEPDQPFEATHAVVLADCQLRTELWPEATCCGVATRLTVGRAG
jgi:hypothetical protein